MDTFSIESYERLLEELKRQGSFLDGFAVVQDQGVLLRHDVDYCLSTAAKLAKINHAHSVTATFFILVSSPLYNIFSADGRLALRQIIEAGQNIGLHYHHMGGPLNTERLEREFAALKLVVPDTQRVVAWHNPEGELAELNAKANDAGFITTYEKQFFGPDLYVSDSNMQRSPDEIIQSIRLAKERLLQVLLHPLIWVSGQINMLPALQAMCESKKQRLDQAFMENRVWAGQVSKNGDR